MKQLWIAGCTLLCTSTVCAEDAFVYYAGLAAGLNLNGAQLTDSSTLTIPTQFATTTHGDQYVNALNAVGKVQLGAGFRASSYYLGAELSGEVFNGNFGSVSDGFTDTQPPLSMRDQSSVYLNDFELALDLKPGVYFYKHTLLYARVGVGMNELTLEQKADASNTDTHQTIQNHHSTSEDVYPWRVGIGIERRFHEDFSVALDYVYTQYENISQSHHAISEELEDSTLDSSSSASDISRQTIMLGFNYYL